MSMSATKNFKSYNFVTGAVDGTLAYDFSSPAYYPQEEIYETPPKRPEPRETIWVREDVREKVQTVVRSRQGFSPLAVMGVLCVVLLLVMTLLAQIQLVTISRSAATLESQIAELEAERDKLTVEYETIFNLKDVEEYAVGVLGMQEPREDQIYYLTSVSSADKAVVISNSDVTNMFSSGLDDLLASVKAYFS